MRKKVLHVTTGLQLGGAEQSLFRLIEATSEYEHSVVSMTDDGPFVERLSALGIDVSSLSMKRGVPSLKATRKLSTLINEFEPHLVHAWMYHANLMTSATKVIGRNRQPVIWGIRHSLAAFRDEKLSLRLAIRVGARLSRLPTAIVFNSRSSMQDHVRIGYNEISSEYIPNGIDCSVFSRNPEQGQSFREEIGISDDAIVVLTLARFHPSKDHSTFLRAAALLADKLPNLFFVLAGDGMSSTNEAVLRIIPPNLAKRVALLGRRSDIVRILSGSNLLCLSSVTESFPNVLAESMAVGTPCVSTDVGDASDIIGQIGILVKPHSYLELAAAIENIATEPEERTQLRSKRGRERIVERFSIHQVSRSYLALYKRLIEEAD